MATIKGVSSFSAEQEAHALRKAMKGLGTDEDAIIEILTKLNVSQRQQVLITYKSSIGRDLIDDLKSELSGNFERVIIGMMTPTTMYDVHELRRAVKGAGTDEGCLIEILASRTNEEIRRINENYKCHRTSESKRCHQQDCQQPQGLEFHPETESGLGTDDNTLIRVMVSRSEIDMLHIRREFLTMYGKSLYSFIKGDCSGDYRKVLLRLCGGED
ncbi:annexin a4 [Limosa lapponica baueri]|uniref:Annexin n=1 Tax=Limosa lapponica baueri TaxID=1758121 RepID=A0A2I0TJK5_LIMLA|nr:annexin a4 [Limosa lapponica baueri]